MVDVYLYLMLGKILSYYIVSCKNNLDIEFHEILFINHGIHKTDPDILGLR